MREEPGLDMLVPSKSSQPGQPDALVEQCLQGDGEALTALREQHHSTLGKILIARGASASEAEDILADLWADCIAGGEKGSLLEKFTNKCSLGGWLATVATNRWIDLKRRQERLSQVAASTDGHGTDLIQRVPASLTPIAEGSLIGLLRDSLQAAFRACSAESIVLLRLVYLHGLTQREVRQMLGWSESKVSRFLAETMARIEKETLRSIKQRDPWLDLTWQDFLDLCQTYDVGFG